MEIVLLRNFKTKVGSAKLPTRGTTAGPPRARSLRLVFERLEARLALDIGALLISEFMADNDSGLADGDGDFEDWLEIHNPTTEPVDLGGWYLTDKVEVPTLWQFPSTVLGSGEYLVVFASSKYPSGPAGELHTSFKLDRGGEYLALMRPDGATVEFAYAPEYPRQYGDVSYGLSPDFSMEGYFTSPTPGLPNVGEPVADPTLQVLISEIMYHPATETYDPAGGAMQEEYLELFNGGIAPVGLLNWRLSDGVEFTFPDVTLGAGEYLVVAADVATFNSTYTAPPGTTVVGGWTGRLSNRGEEIELVDALGNRVDRVRYADEGDWSVRERGLMDHQHQGWVWANDHDGLGQSLELINPVMSNKYGQNWAASNPGPTPGEANSVAAGDIGPMILDASHFPIIPRSTDPVTVTARLKDELATGLTATVYYRDDGEPAFTTVAMLDDGLSGDAAAGDGVYSAVLPARPDGTVVEFYIEATDEAANTRTWPGPTRPTMQQLTNLLYQVDDTFDPTGEWIPGSQPIYYLIMTEAERAELEDIGDDGNPFTGEGRSDAQMNGTLISVDGTETTLHYNVGIRNRGNRSRVTPPMNYRVNFPHDEAWKDVTAININSKYAHDQVIGSAIFRLAGTAAPFATPVEVRVNGENLALTDPGRMHGVYAALEVYDNDWAEHHFPDAADGNLYRGTYFVLPGGGRTYADLYYKGDPPYRNPDDYRNNYPKHTNQAEDDWTDLLELIDRLNNPSISDDDFVERLSQVIDLQQWLRYLATDFLLGNGEGGLITGSGDDYAMYRGEDGRFRLLPHDLDTLFSNRTTSIWEYEDIRGLRRLLNHPEIQNLYFRQYLDLINTIFAPENFDPLIDEILKGVAPQSSIDQMKQFVVSRAASVLAQIPQQFTINSDLPQLGGYAYTTLPALDLGGTAPGADTRSVLVDGRLADWNPRTGQWSIGSQTGIVTETLVAPGATSLWRYLDDGSDQQTAWRTAAFDDAGWAEGGAQLGYGEGDETTVVGFGPDSGNKYITTYFRHSFEVTDPARYTGLTLRLLRDDGAVIYLNGQEVLRSNMPNGAIDYRTRASSTISGGAEDAFNPFSIDPALLVDGTNVLAVEIHQASATSSDISFDLELEASIQNPTGMPLTRGVNRVVVEAFDGPDAAGKLVDSGYIDVWYDPPVEKGVRNLLPGAPEGPFRQKVPEHFFPKASKSQQLDVVVRDSYLAEVPFLVHAEVLDEQGNVDRDLRDAVVTLSTDRPAEITLSTDQIRLYNGLGSALVTASGDGDFTLIATFGGLEINRTLVSLSGEPMTEVSGTLLPGETDWSGIIHVTGDVLVPASETLTIDPGTLVLIDGVVSGSDGTDIDVQGNIQSLGTAAQPVTFTAFDPAMAWGEIHHDNAAPSLYQYTHITRGGNSPGGGHTGTGPMVRPVGSTIIFDHGSLTDAAGKIMQSSSGSDLTFRNSHLARAIMGPEIDNTALLMEDSWITEMFGPDDDDGIYIHSQQAGQTVLMRRGVIAQTDDDGLDTLQSTVTVEDYIFRDAFDKGVSVFGGQVTINGMLSADNGIGISAKDRGTGNPHVYLDHATIIGNDIGIEVNDKYGEPNVVVEYFVSNSILWDNTLSVRTDYDPADIHIDWSNVEGTWPGTGNLDADPLFVDAAAGDLHLQLGSPSIDAGDPASAVDPDGTWPDQGYYVSNPGGSRVPGIIPGGSITEDMVLSAEAGPWRVIGDVVVDAGVTLTILPGTTVFFEGDTSFTINGRLVAEGTQYEQIRLTRLPGGGTWNGVQFVDTMEDNRITYAVLEYGRTDNGMVGVVNSNLLIDHVTFDHTDLRRIRTLDSSLIVRDSTFTNIFEFGEPPTTNNRSEHIWGRAPASGHFIIENNVFGTITGHNDAIDVDGRTRPDTVMQYLNNVFLGGGDDALDLEGDAHIEGNVFLHYHKDQWNTGSGNANVISAGAGHDYVMVRNFFYDMDHVAQVKNGSFMTFVNNTVVDVDVSALYFLRPTSQTGYGRGAYLDGNIFVNLPLLVDKVGPTTEVTVKRNILYPYAFDPGVDVGDWSEGNIFEDPRLPEIEDTGPAGSDFSLRAGSPGFGTGPNGVDIGADVSGGVSISGEPPAITSRTEATLTIGIPGIPAPAYAPMTHYKYRLIDGPWSEETPVEVPVELSGLTDGDYTVFAIGKNSAGVWQEEAEASASKTWTVDTSLARVQINEVLAINDSAVDSGGTFPDLIELYNDGPLPLDLAGMSITDDANDPTRFVFPSDNPAKTTIPAFGYLVLNAGAVGFALNGDGEGVFLYDTAANGGGLLDSVEFGMQVPDLSIGRVGHAGDWALTRPTFGAANIVGQADAAQRTGDPARLKINEWLVYGEVLFADDFVEIYNPDPLPVSLSGLYLTDNPVAQASCLRDRQEACPNKIAPLSFVAGSGFAVFTADGDPEEGPAHVDFRFSRDQEMIGLFESRTLDSGLSSFAPIDQIIYYPQTTDVSQGRSPNGAATYAFSELPTPGLSNPHGETVSAAAIAIDDVWSYEESGRDLGTQWREPGFDDSAWPAGAALLYAENEALPAPKNTPLSLGSTTYYFRKHFTLDADPAELTEFYISTVIDDGAVIYINAQEVMRLRIDPGDIDFQTFANQAVNEAAYEGPFLLPTDALVQGDNVIAVEVHQVSAGSSDIVFGLTLDANVSTFGPDPEYAELFERGLEILGGLRVTEIMYHPADDGDAEFIELQNVSDATLDLTGVRLSDAVEFTFPRLMLAPGQYVVVVRDWEAFELRYGSSYNVAGQYSGNLSNGGEDIVLQLPEPLQAAALRFKYSDAWYPATDGGGLALEIRDWAGKPATWNDAENWLPGTIQGGTPGTADGQPVGGVVINEVLTHTDEPELDAIELYNPTGGDIDVGGWYLSDSGSNYQKFQIPGGTILAAGEYVVFDEDDFNPQAGIRDWRLGIGVKRANLGDESPTANSQFPNPQSLIPFALSGAHGDDVWLVEADRSGEPTRIVDHVQFGAAVSGESLGRWPNRPFGGNSRSNVALGKLATAEIATDGLGRLYPMTAVTLGGENSGPRIGPVIISEVHYHPDDLNANDLEFVEIFNATAETLELTNWRLRKGVDFDFAPGTQIGPRGVLVVVPFDPSDAGKLAAFNAEYRVQLVAGVDVVGGYSAQLSDSGEKVQLQRPDDPPPDEPAFIPHVLEDEVIYDDEDPWPGGPDGGGTSLTRLDADVWGNDSASWVSATPTPGVVDIAAQVAGRYVFYNDSVFDGKDAAAGARDDAAIAPDKEALLPGQTASFANYTSYDRGINGIMIDVDGLPPGVTLRADHFRFRVGNSNDPSGWAAAPIPSTITVRPGEGVDGSDRVTLIWDDHLIEKEWLQVTVPANTHTALAVEDVFYFGNAIGESGDSTADAKVNVFDMLGARDNPRTFLNPASIDFRYDFNRDARVNSYDMLIARDSQTHFLNALKLITVPANKAAEASAVEMASIPAQDAVLKQAAGRPSGGREISLAKFDWVYEFEQTARQRRSSEQSGSGQQTVDRILADWP